MTTSRTGTDASSTTTATCDAVAISLRIVATPPRVASRSTRTPSPPASSSPAVSSCSGAVSETRSASMSSSPRASMIVMPWSPSGPETMTASPGRAAPALSVTGLSRTPTPAVVMKHPSALPRGTTLVSPVTIWTPAAAAARAIESAIRRRSATPKPSSRMNPAER